MSKKINLKINQDLMEEVKSIAANKWPRRKITTYSGAIIEALIEFVKRNQKFNNKQEKNQTIAKNQKETINA